MKVKIQQRSVYHKFAEVEIEIPNNIKTEDLTDYLWDNEHLYVDKIDDAISKASYVFGFGIDLDSDMNEFDQESEWRYEIVDKNYGGHL